MLQEFKLEQNSETPRPDAMKRLYVELIRLSGRVHAEIRILRTIEKTLSRPFMFSGVQYDGEHMHHQMKRKRLQILGQMPELSDSNELKMFMLASGTMSDIRQIEPAEFELKEDEPLWSESSSGSEDDDFDAINRLNDNSMEKLEGVKGAKKQNK